MGHRCGSILHDPVGLIFTGDGIQIVIKVAYGVGITIIICFRNPPDEPYKCHRFAMTMRNFRISNSSTSVKAGFFYFILSCLFYFILLRNLVPF